MCFDMLRGTKKWKKTGDGHRGGFRGLLGREPAPGDAYREGRGAQAARGRIDSRVRVVTCLDSWCCLCVSWRGDWMIRVHNFESRFWEGLDGSFAPVQVIRATISYHIISHISYANSKWPVGFCFCANFHSFFQSFPHYGIYFELWCSGLPLKILIFIDNTAVSWGCTPLSYDTTGPPFFFPFSLGEGCIYLIIYIIYEVYYIPGIQIIRIYFRQLCACTYGIPLMINTTQQ